MDDKYDVIIIGSGPAGLSAGIYTARDKLKTLLIEKGIIGGKITEAELVDNFPGYPEGVSGLELTRKMHQQAMKFGLKELYAEVVSIEIGNERKVVKTTAGDFITRALIVAGGSDWAKLGVPGEKELIGRGVSYCSTCDAPFFADKRVAVIGGGNTALFEAIHLAKFAAKVTVIHRRNEFRAFIAVQEKIYAVPKIKFLMSTEVEAIEGTDIVRQLRLKQTDGDKKSTLEVDGVFIAVGLKPNTDYLKEVLPLDEQGRIIVDSEMRTKIVAIYAVGDIRSKSIRQTIAAAGDGAVAAITAKKDIEQ
jgi:thioredoxin reductase (NADPH)